MHLYVAVVFRIESQWIKAVFDMFFRLYSTQTLTQILLSRSAVLCTCTGAVNQFRSCVSLNLQLILNEITNMMESFLHFCWENRKAARLGSVGCV